jgi:catechol 2,3-dioxygenase-like lactoylglutathione lyase family enzyme
MIQDTDTVHVRYMVEDVATAVTFYTAHLGFTLLTNFPAFADVKRGNLRLLLSGRASSAGRPMPDGRQPGPGGWNRIHLLVEDIDAEVARLRGAGVSFRSDVVTGPGGKQMCSTIRPATRSNSSSHLDADGAESSEVGRAYVLFAAAPMPRQHMAERGNVRRVRFPRQYVQRQVVRRICRSRQPDVGPHEALVHRVAQALHVSFQEHTRGREG